MAFPALIFPRRVEHALNVAIQCPQANQSTDKGLIIAVPVKVDRMAAENVAIFLVAVARRTSARVTPTWQTLVDAVGNNDKDDHHGGE